MKKLLLSLLVMSALVLSVVPGVFATMVGTGVPVTIVTEDFAPVVWQCDHRVVYDDATEPGRISGPGQELVERINNYAFEGEQVKWKVLVMDKNGIDKVADVYMTVDGEKQANCDRLTWTNNHEILDSCNARILEENVDTWNSDLMAYYECTLTVESPETGMEGQVDVTVEAIDLGDDEEDGLIGTMAETETWYLNPGIELGLDGDISFSEVRPGTSAYSDRVLVTNNADEDSGVLLDMFISGTDFYDSANSGAKCGTSNVLKLENFRYYATSGAYSTHQDSRADDEGYAPIEYGKGFNDPNPFYNNNEIIQSSTKLGGAYYAGNVLTPGADLALVFRLNLPEPCNGDFDTGNIFFWGEAI
jgi:hypothetical protein